ncbi:MAG: ABC transporter permease [Burkholderiales bacterium]|nr:ABC transporter permease [Anaerolineae bacterium]
MAFGQRVISNALSAVMVIWLAATLAFFALRVVPGDAITAQLANSGASQAQIEQRRIDEGLDVPVPMQYLRFMGGLLRGDLGRSLANGQPVTQLISEQLGPTMILATAAFMVATLLGVSLGIFGALDLQPGISAGSRLLISFALSTPIYLTGTIAIFVFTVQLGLLPSAGSGRLSQLILPAAVLGFHTSGAIAQVMQASVSEVLGADFVMTARSKGLSELRIVIYHIVRVAIVPVISVLALQAGFLFSGTVITESLFVRSGVGRLLLQAVIGQDYTVVQGIVILSAVIYVCANSLSNAVAYWLDPRLAR